MSQRPTRRTFLAQSSAVAAAGVTVPYWVASRTARAAESKNDRPLVGCIGTGDRWKGGIVDPLREHGDIVAVCDVDRKHAEEGRAKAGGKAYIY
jgi:hypothetical protein